MTTLQFMQRRWSLHLVNVTDEVAGISLACEITNNVSKKVIHMHFANRAGAHDNYIMLEVNGMY